MTVEIQTAATIRARLIAMALLRTSQLTQASFVAGSIPDTFAGMVADMGEDAQRVSALHVLETFVRTAFGADLDRLASDHYGIVRNSDVAAVGTVTFTRPINTGPELIPLGTLLGSTGGPQFVTTSEPLMLGLTVDATVQAVLVGTSGNIPAGTITSILTPLTDATITVNNAQVTAGGASAESDDEYRERIFAFFPTIRRGTALALKTGALNVPGVASATVNDTTYPPTVYVADVNGNSNVALIAAVVTELVNWRAAGVPVNVVGAVTVFQSISATLVFAPGFDTLSNRAAVATAIATSINSLETGDTMFLSALVAAAFAATLGLENVVITSPGADVVPAANALLRSSSSLVTLS